MRSLGTMTGHGSWMGLFVVGTDRRAVRELLATTIPGRRVRRPFGPELRVKGSRPTNDTGNGHTTTITT